MPFIAALKSLWPKRKPKRSKLLAPIVDPRFEHPAYKNIPEELLRALGDPTYLRNPPYHDGYYGLISGEFCMRKFQGKLMGKLKRQSGLSPEEYKSYLEPILIAYAELVHLLPASEHHHHNTPGGLLRHGLEAACFMLDWMVMTKFDHELTPAEASKRLRRWYVAGIIAALFHDAGKPLTDVRVMSFEGEQEWFPGARTIHEWAVEYKITRYFITWVKDRVESHQNETSRLLGKYVTSDIEEWLVQGGKDIWKAMLNATNDQPGPLTQAVKIADSRSVKADRERCGNTEGEATTGVPVQRLCVDAMRHLLDEGKWTFNNPGSRLWKSTQGVFLAWTAGSDDIIQHVMKGNIGGFPRGDISLLAAMSERELIEKNSDGSPIWFVAPHPLQKNGKGPSIRCVKLRNPDGVFPSVLGVISEVSVTIGRDDDAKEFLNEEDAKQRAAEAKAAKHSPQNDLFATQQDKPAPANKQKKKTQPEKPAKERIGVSLPPELAAQVQASKSKDISVEPDQAIGEASEEELEPDDIKLGDLDDETLTSMLIELGGSSTQPTEDVAQSVDGAEPESVDSTAASDALAAEAADLEDEFVKAFGQKGLKLTLSDLMKKPERVKRDPQDATPKQRSSIAAGDAQCPPISPAAPAESPAGDDVLVIPKPFIGKLSDDAMTCFKRNPPLASRLLTVFVAEPSMREIRNRVFVPLVEPLSEADVPAIEAAGWLWRDYTSPEEATTRMAHKKVGFLGSKELTSIYCELVQPKWVLKQIEDIPEAERAEASRFAESLKQVATPEPAKGKGVFFIPFWTRDKTIQSHGISIEAAEIALLCCLDAVKVSKEKKYYFRVEDQE